MKNKTYPLANEITNIDTVFNNPPAIYRGAPLWSWNGALEREDLLRQIETFKTMGLGGFHIHPRTGLEVKYMGDEFMELVKESNEKAKKNEMLCWLYDEDRWPAGYGGGYVTENHDFRMQYLLFTPFPYEGESQKFAVGNTVSGGRNEEGVLSARYEIVIKDGFLTQYKRLKEGEKAREGSVVWYAYLETAIDKPWFNNQAYVNTMDKKAIECFIEKTHEKYKKLLGDDFGKSVPAIFTDEPQICHKLFLSFADEKKNLNLPFDKYFSDTFKKMYGVDILDHLPEVIWELPNGKVSIHRYHYHEHIVERFTKAFSDTVGAWCDKNNIALTGHMMHEDTLEAQSMALGEVMRAYRSFQIPGIDVLCDGIVLNTAKQAASVCHQYGRPGVLSELYGVTNWDFSFLGHKVQGDWQAAMGVTFRVHHLSWVSMKGEAKRDYPASISYQSPWWEEYRQVEDHFARVNYILTRGKPLVKIAIVHPIESFWLSCGPLNQTHELRQGLDAQFKNLTDWLLYSHLDFDFVCESLLPEQNVSSKNGKMKVGEMEYDVVIVPNLRTIRNTTLSLLKSFSKSNGNLIFLGGLPTLVDGVPSKSVLKTFTNPKIIPFLRYNVLTELETARILDIKDRNGKTPTSLLSQFRQEGSSLHLFICNTSKTNELNQLSISLKGNWDVILNNTKDGKRYHLSENHFKFNGKNTDLKWNMEAGGHLLFTLEPAKGIKENKLPLYNSLILSKEEHRWSGKVPVELSEPNALLLDRASWKINEEAWQPETHTLDIEAVVRKHFKLAERGGRMAQPYSQPDLHKSLGSLTIRVQFESKINVKGAYLAVEEVSDTENVKITLDGKSIPISIAGYWVDNSLKKIPLPNFTPGTHTIEITRPYTCNSYTEWCYILGDFGVQVEGDKAFIVEPVTSLAFGNITTQGLPFYSGNITYCLESPRDMSNINIQVHNFKGTTVNVFSSDGNKLELPYPPYAGTIENIKKGDMIRVTLYGSRINSHGPLHWNRKGDNWVGPPAWRQVGDNWVDEYQLTPIGIMSSPLLKS